MPAITGDVVGNVLDATSADALARVIRHAVADILETSPNQIVDDVSFRDLGMDSRQVVRLADDVSASVGRQLRTTELWQYSSVAQLAAYLAGADERAADAEPAVRRRADSEPLAIVGIACRLPGDIDGPESMWKALLSGIDTIREVPTDRWNAAAWLDEDPRAAGKMTTRWGGFLSDVRGFDAGFFGISPTEARHMDPQQRLALEGAWRALEDARIVPSELRGSRTGVFFGAMWQEYGLVAGARPEIIEQHSATGWDNSIVAARIAYVLGLQAPALTVNTACSSSLVAVHLAAQSLRSGESDLALVGGVNLMLTPHTTVQLTKLGAMNPQGKCRVFDADANGYVRGEGCGVVVLRRLSDAQARGDRIYAVVCGSAVNNDGASNGITAPNQQAQTDVVRTAWREAGIPAVEVSYVEAHGTGTPLGDPIEAGGLAAAFAEGRDVPLMIGSAKSNFGHLEAAAGITGLLKVVLSLHHGRLPPSLHFARPNPRIDFDALKLKVVTEPTSWPSHVRRRCAGVSAFGFGGTNAHVALAEAPGARALSVRVQADSEQALRAGVEALLDEVSARGASALDDARCVGNGAFRSVLRGRDEEQLVAAGRGLLASSKLAPVLAAPKLVFVFSGHGSQWLGMGRDLLTSEPAFRAALEECDQVLAELGAFSIVDELTRPAEQSRLSRIDVVQPVLFGLQLALCRVLAAWGIRPDVVLGQSIGDVAAAVVSGALSLAQGVRVICLWSKLIEERAAGQGSLVVAELPPERLRLLLQEKHHPLTVAGHPAPEQTAVAGSLSALEALERDLLEQGVRVHQVDIAYAAHGAQMVPLLPRLRDLLADVTPERCAIPFWSSCRGRLVDGSELNADYWTHNLSAPFDLVSATERLSEDGPVAFVEIAPHPVLSYGLRKTLERAERAASVFASCERGKGARDGLEALASALWCQGVAVDWDAVSHSGRSNADGLPLPLLVSGRSKEALRLNAEQLAQFVETTRHDLTDVAYSLAKSRSQFEERAVVLADSKLQAAQALRALATGEHASELVEGRAVRRGRSASGLRPVLVFSGQGSQWHAMGKQLLSESPVFRSVLHACDAALSPLTGWSVLALLNGEADASAPPADRIDVVQPALFAMAMGLAAVWQDELGVEPLAVVGHSLGEIAAAVVAGALTLEEGARIVALRSRALHVEAPHGSMLIVERPCAEVEQYLLPYGGSLSIAAVNTASSTIVSGSPEAAQRFQQQLQSEGVFCRQIAAHVAGHSAQMEPLLPGLREGLRSLAPRPPRIAFYSTVTGALLTPEQALDADYWCRNLRETVRFDLALAALLANEQHRCFIEVSPHPALAMPLSVACAERDAVVAPSLQRERGGLDQLYRSAALLHVSGLGPDWSKLLAKRGARVVDVPRYAFVRQPYWLSVKPQSDVSGLGLTRVAHPILGAMSPLADGAGHVFSGRISLSDRSWLGDHAAGATALFPGAGTLELALCAAAALGAGAVSELVLTQPLLYGEDGCALVQVLVSSPDASGQRRLAVYSRAHDQTSWVTNATGSLQAGAASTLEQARFDELAHVPGAQWQAQDLAGAYEQLAASDYAYGPAFRGLCELYRGDGRSYARVELPESVVDADEFGVHPALLDAVLHAVLLALGTDDRSADEILLPFAWSDVTLLASGAREAWASIELLPSASSAEKLVSIALVDAAGMPLLRIGQLKLRNARREQFKQSARRLQHLYRIALAPVILDATTKITAAHVIVGEPAGLARTLGADFYADLAALREQIRAGAAVPERIVLDACGGPDTQGVVVDAAAVHEATARALGELQLLLTEPSFAKSELVWVTRGAAAADDDAPIQDLVHAGVWGLVRTARSEHPERALRLINLAGACDADALRAALALAGEPELWIRDGRVLAPRLTAVPDAASQAEESGRAARALNPSGTVLLTGGTGELGRSIAERLVRDHGVRHLLLVSRRGIDAAATEVVDHLRAQGAETVRVCACDISVRADVERTLASIEPEHPLTGVVHLAAVLEDGVLTSLTRERLDRSLAPKVDGALHLHALTEHAELAMFVMFSSAIGTLGGGGQGNYAAANTFLDALALYRRQRGLAAQSLAWGLWQQAGIGMSSRLSEADIARLRRQGLPPMTLDEGLNLFTAALQRTEALLVPARFDLAAVQASSFGNLPPMFRQLVQPGLRRAAAAASQGGSQLRTSLAALPEPERVAAITRTIQAEIGIVLGLPTGQVDPSRELKSFGLDSLMAVDLRNRISALVGTSLPSTLAFDYPTPAALARFCLRQMQIEQPAPATRTRAVEHGAKDEPIAIVSMACRLPGGISDPESYWELLREERSAIEGFPERWAALDIYDPDPDAVGKSYVREGGFIREVEQFDASFFGISAREALDMDPQQRLMLETAWEALERAGIPPAALNETATGVYLGSMGSDYGSQSAGFDSASGYTTTGRASSVLSGRLSYTLGLRGPALTVDTACSSSLVALHLACNALRNRECDMALAGGVTVMNTPIIFVEFSRLRATSPTARCRSFSADADGAVWSEGCGLLVLKRLADARRDGDRVLALIRGTAVNQDGRSQGLTAPNGPSQQQLIQEALAVSRLSPADIDAIEAHGTGTTLGDPIEAGALAAVFGAERDPERPVYLGASKSNLGHTQAASGVAGVMKLVLALQHELLPRTLHAEQLSEHVTWQNSGLSLLQQARAWPKSRRPRRAGVSSFGIGGTNAHVVLEEAPADTKPLQEAAPNATQPLPLVLSGRDEAALRAQAQRWANWLRAHPEHAYADVVRTAAQKRAHFEHRAAVVASGLEEAIAGLDALAHGASHASCVSGRAAPEGERAILFTGQGSQQPAMGRELYATHAVYRKTLDALCAALDVHLKESLQSVMFAEPETDLSRLLDRTEYTQPALFAHEVSLYRLWESWGIRARFVAGHSIGELSAAFVAGVWSLEDAAKLVCARGRLMQACRPDGAMVSLEASEAEVLAALRGREDQLSIAGINGPSQVVVSGDADITAKVAAEFAAQGRRTRALNVSHAFHSAHMDGMLQEFERIAASCTFHPPQLSVVSLLTGKIATQGELETASYWVQQVRRAVRFHDGLTTLSDAGVRRFLECGPDGVLTAMSRACLSEDDSYAIASQRKGTDEARALMLALAALHVSGQSIAWPALLGDAHELVPLPTYAFQRQRYWVELSERSAQVRESDAERALWDAVDKGELGTVSELLALQEGELPGVAPLLPRLSSWRQREREAAQTRDWLYEDTWHLTRTPAQRSLSGTWLLVSPSAQQGVQQLEDALSDLLVGAGAQVRKLVASSDPERLGEQLSALSEEVSGVLSLSGLAEAAAQSRTSLLETTVLAQCMVNAGLKAPLWLLTRGAVQAQPGERASDVLQAQLWGLGRCISLEHPECWGGLIDLPREQSPQTLSHLLDVLTARDDEDQVALRADGRLVRRLSRVSKHRSAKAWRARGTVLVTGGSGALAEHLARWLSERGAEHVVLASRRGSEANGAAALKAELEQQGTRVTLARCDMSRRADVERLIGELQSDATPLRAVMHLAGVGAFASVRELSADVLERELGAKVDGALYLHELLADTELDAFVLYGSGAAVWGGSGQGAYGAANAALDAVAQQRRENGLHALVVHWGPWADGGMLTQDADAHYRRRGVRSMAPSKALRGLELGLTGDRVALGVFDIDWSLFAPVYNAARRRPLISEIAEARAALEQSKAEAATNGPARARLLDLPGQDHYRFLQELVAHEAAATLGMSDASALSTSRGFTELGFDSLTALELSKRVQQRTGVVTPKTLTFDHPNIDAAARWLLTELSPELAEAGSQVRTLASDEPIAIVGLGLRMPGGAGDLESFWRVLSEGRDTVSEVPPERFDVDAIYSPDTEQLDKTYCRRAAFLDDVTSFDAKFFGISPREAEPMDPQHRLLLQTGWSALEDAGLRADALRDTDTGVFVGAAAGEYFQRIAGTAQDAYAMTGSAPSFNAGRLSYHLGLQGPALTVDTACSSSLVALHLACSALRRGECQVALAGGVQVIANPELFVMLSRARAMAADGRCKTFSESADGYGRGEGVAMLVLMRLSEAQAQGKRVLAVVRGSAVNNDGTSSGITAPNGTSQQKVLRAALGDAGLEPHQIDYVECHGTGTSLGDPIEVQALGAVYGRGRSADRPLKVGAVKSNIGHLESASGVAGVCKVIAAMRYGALPASLHSSPRNPHIAWDELAVHVVDQQEPWTSEGGVRRAAVSAFGLSGTNAHVILEEAPAAQDVVSRAPVSRAVPLLVSARDEESLRAQAMRWSEWLRAHPETDLTDVAFSTLQRSQFEQRAAVLAEDIDGALAGLDALAKDARHPAVSRGIARMPGKLVFVFPGHGGQWLGMGRELLKESPVFLQTVEACDAALRVYTGWSMLALLRGDEGPDVPALERLDVVQPAIFTVCVGLAAVLRSLGVEPSAVVGHSQGEVAAAYVAGALSLEDAARVVTARSRAMEELEPNGAMLLIERPVSEVEQYLASYGSSLSISAVNTPSSTVVGGERAAAERLLSELQARGVFCRAIKGADRAGHSAQMEPLLPALRKTLSGLRPQRASLPFFSTVRGERLSAEQMLDGEYWCQNLRRTVRFDQALEQLLKSGHHVFVEVGPHPVLAMPLSGACAEVQGLAVGTMQRERGDMATLLRTLSELHVAGVTLPWERVISAGRTVDLPTYAFRRDRYWIEPSKGQSDPASMGLTAVEHPLLSAMSPLADSDGYIFSGRVSLREQRWLADHAAFGVVLFPGAGSIDLALCAARTVGARGVAELTLAAPLILTESDSAQLQLSLSADVEGRRELTLYSRSAEGDGSWTQHATGILMGEGGAERVEDPDFAVLRQWPTSEWEALPLDDFYANLRPQGFEYGPAFQGLTELFRGDNAVYGRVKLPAGVREASDYGLHPALLDAALHTTLSLVTGLAEDGVSLPFAWSDVELFATGAEELRVSVTFASAGEDGTAVRVLIADGNGEPVLRVGEFRSRRVRADQLRAVQRKTAQDLYRVQLQPVELQYELAAEVSQAVLWSEDANQLGILAPRYADLRDLQRVLDDGGSAPKRIVVDATGALVRSAQGFDAVQAVTSHALSLIQDWLSDPRLSESELTLLTRGAVDLGAGVTDLKSAPLWGLARAVRREHPDRMLRMLDLGADRSSAVTLEAALSATHEPELMLSSEQAFAPRLVRFTPSETSAPLALDVAGTYLITGGTGQLGRAVAAHLVQNHGVRHLLLTSRSGAEAAGLDAVVSEMKAAGAESVRIEACDVALRSELERVFSSIPADRPLRGVLHLAGVVDDGVVTAQTEERLRRVMAPKVGGALNLDALTQGMQLSMFLLFSGGAGTLGSAGQSNYCAANAFLDALAAQRRARGLVGQSLAWGLWEQGEVGMTSQLRNLDLQRLTRLGMVAMNATHALALFDAAIASGEASLMPAKLDLARMQKQLAGSEPPALLRVLLRSGLRRAKAGEQDASALRVRLAAVAEPKRLAWLIELVRSEVAQVLGLSGPSAVSPARELKTFGFDSLMAVELRNRLSALVGSSLPPTLAFDYPTPAALGELLLARILPAAAAAKKPKVTRQEIRSLAELLGTASAEQLEAHGLLSGLWKLRDALKSNGSHATPKAEVDLSDRDELFRFLEERVGAE